MAICASRIRQHTSAYINTRQTRSAYDLLRELSLLCASDSMLMCTRTQTQTDTDKKKHAHTHTYTCPLCVSHHATTTRTMNRERGSLLASHRYSTKHTLMHSTQHTLTYAQYLWGPCVSLLSSLVSLALARNPSLSVSLYHIIYIYIYIYIHTYIICLSMFLCLYNI
jgi:hypothetical protein